MIVRTGYDAAACLDMALEHAIDAVVDEALNIFPADAPKEARSLARWALDWQGAWAWGEAP